MSVRGGVPPEKKKIESNNSEVVLVFSMCIADSARSVFLTIFMDITSVGRNADFIKGV